MAYATGTAFSQQSLLSALSGFLQANGWTLHDTVASNDLVFKSVGTGGKQNHYVRVTNEARELDFDAQTADFTVGETITGATSGSSAVILSQTDAGTTGTLTLVEVTGHFIDNEIITDGLGGSATVNQRLRFATYPDPTRVENCVDHLLVRAYTYWDAGTNTGVNPQGQWGPLNLAVAQNYFAIYAQRTLNPGALQSFEYAKTPFMMTQGAFGAFDGQRRFFSRGIGQTPLALNTGYTKGWSTPNAQASTTWGDPVVDLASLGDAERARVGIETQSFADRAHVGVIVHSKTGDHFHQYGFKSGNLQTNQWGRWHSDDGSWEFLSPPPFDITYPNALIPLSAWDGGDYIYVVGNITGQVGTSTHIFVRYQISTDSWTYLADTPEFNANSAGVNASNGLYIPRGVIPGVDEDVVYFLFSQQAYPANNKLWRYNVTSNTWSDEITLPYHYLFGRSSLAWDGVRYVWYYPDWDLQTNFRLDLQNIGGGWQTFDLFPGLSLGNSQAFRYAAPWPCKIRTRTGGPVTYHFVGDADFVAVITTIGDHTYWTGFGLLDTYLNPALATTTAPAVSGALVTVAVDSSTGFSVGDDVMVLDPTNGHVEASAIASVPDATHLQLRLTTAIATGSRVFIDAIHTALVGDNGLATLSYDRLGYQAEGMASSYVVKALGDREFTKRGPSSRQNAPMAPLTVSGPSPALATWENRGSLPGVFAMADAVYPSPQPGDVVQDANGDQFLVIEAKNAQWTPDERFLAIGPIN